MTRNRYGWRVSVVRDEVDGDVRVRAMYRNAEGKYFVLHNAILQELEERQPLADFPPLNTFTRIEAEDGFESFTQALVDAAWDAGIKPRQLLDAGGPGELEATRRHLEDFRALVFKDKIEPRK